MDKHELIEKLAPDFKMAESIPPCTSIRINREGQAVEVFIDTKANYHGEWIKDEGADICLYFDRDTGRVVGCRLPLKYARVMFGDDSGVDLTIEPPSSKP